MDIYKYIQAEKYEFENVKEHIKRVNMYIYIYIYIYIYS